MTAVAPAKLLAGWTPLLGALSIWFAHFLLIYAAALIWPHQLIARLVAIPATTGALALLAWLFVRLRAATPTSDQTRFARRFGLGALFIAAAGTIFDALPALIH